MSARANFIRMQDSTREHWQLVGAEFKAALQCEAA
jgi:hypothetical protein